jgi:RimJ/RimL family protein N-acetyltransferase
VTLEANRFACQVEPPQDAPSRQPSCVNWRDGLPVLIGPRVALRDLRASDAAQLVASVTAEDVSRFLAPPPVTSHAFEQFIDRALAERRAGSYVCFAVTVPPSDEAIGIFQLRQLEPSFETAEWGFAIDSRYWGTGVFQEGAQLVMEFAFDTLRVRRLEARAAVQNERGHGALRKLGAVREGLLRRSFRRKGEYFDELLWTILAEDWRQAKVIWGGTRPLQ